MPTYQYSCNDCGHFFEVFQSFSDDSLTVCPECGGRLRKVFNAVGVVFKGSGFYRTDSRGSSAGKEPAAASTATGSSGSSDTAASSSSSSSSGSSKGAPSSSSTTSSSSATD